ncbi:MAG: glycosyltransferase [Candidatus Omnitrophota bacterium]
MPAARVRCYNFAIELKKYGVKTDVLSYYDHIETKEEYKFTFLDKVKLNLTVFNRLSKEENSVFFLQRFNYHSFGPYLAKFINKNKLIFDLDDWEIRENPRYILNIWPTSKAEFLTKTIARRANCCIAASHFLFDYLKQYNKNVYYLPTGVDTTLFCLNGEAQNNDVVFSWIGTIHRPDNVENIKFIIDCFNKLSDKYKNIRLEITGDGGYYHQVKSAVKNAGSNRIVLNKWIDPNSMPAYLEQIDVGLLPLVQNTKFNLAKSPVKLFEYMAMAKPVIASYIGEAAQIITDRRTGFLAKNKEEFIEWMEFLITNPEIRKNIGQEARKAVMRYSLGTLIAELSQIIQKI